MFKVPILTCNTRREHEAVADKEMSSNTPQKHGPVAYTGMTSNNRHQHELVEDKMVNVFWLPWSQSHGLSTTWEIDSKACTLIAVLLVHNCYHSSVEFSTDYPSEHLLHTFSLSIEQGNQIYGQLRDKGKLRDKYLNIPEALTAIMPSTIAPVTEWASFIYKGNMLESLFKNLSENLDLWYSNRPPEAKSDVNVVILANLRAVVMLFRQNKEVVTLMDSHKHCPHGAVIALVSNKSLQKLCQWYAMQLIRDTGPIACYELSFIYCS